MPILKRIACLALTGCMVISSCCISFAATKDFRRDKDSIEVSQEEIDFMEEIKRKNKSLVKDQEPESEKAKCLENESTRARIFEEEESNDTFSRADLLYLGERYKGYIDDENDVDIFEIEFDEDGIAKFELWSIPVDCDYDLYVYDSDRNEIEMVS